MNRSSDDRQSEESQEKGMMDLKTWIIVGLISILLFVGVYLLIRYCFNRPQPWRVVQAPCAETPAPVNQSPATSSVYSNTIQQPVLPAKPVANMDKLVESNWDTVVHALKEL